MSAFLCSDLHIAVCALAVSRLVPQVATNITTYKALKALNGLALTVRYGDSPLAIPRNAARMLVQAKVLLAGKGPEWIASVLICLQYQCDEGGTLTMTRTGRVLNAAVEVARRESGGFVDHSVYSL